MERLDNFEKRLEKVYENESLPAKNLESIKNYIEEIQHYGAAEGTAATNIAAFTVLSKWCTIPFSNLTKIDVFKFFKHLKKYKFKRSGKEYHYSDATIHSYKLVYRKFFAGNEKIEGRNPEIAIFFKEVKPERSNRMQKENLLTEKEVYSMINAAKNPRDKAIVATLYESGGRRGELLSCRIKHIDFSPMKYCKLTFPEGKSGRRTVELVMCRSFLRAWVESHPQRLPNGKPDPDAYLCISLHGKKNPKTGALEYHRLSEPGLYEQLQRIAKSIGITKRVNPHAWRHARATKLAEHFTEQVMKQYLGWSADSDMAAVYVHSPETKNAVLKMYDIKNDEQDRALEAGEKICPNCKREISTLAAYCQFCGHTEGRIEEQFEKEDAEVLKALLRIAKKSSSVETLLNKIIEEEE